MRKDSINCGSCIDCQRMISPDGVSWKCYGSLNGTEIKRRLTGFNEGPPETSPDWCPHRVCQKTIK